MLRVSALTALVVASTLGAVAFFAAPAEGGEKTHPTVEMTQHETIEGTAQSGDSLAVQSSGFDGNCLLVLAEYGTPYPTPDDLSNDNTIRLPPEVCLTFTRMISELVSAGILSFEEDLRYQQYY